MTLLVTNESFWLGPLLGIVAAAADLIGGFFTVCREWSRTVLKSFIALGAGFMLAVAILDMIPEAIKLHAGFVTDKPNPPTLVSMTDVTHVISWVLAGYLLIHFFEHTLAPHFHFGEETHVDEIARAHVGYAAVIGLSIHTFFDGVAIGSGLIVSPLLGVVIFVAIFLHKVPEGFAVASVMLASGQGKSAAFLSSAFLGLATLLGVGSMYFLGPQVEIALPISAGVTLYVAASDLIPEVNHERGVRWALLVFLGVAVVIAAGYAFGL